MHPAPCTPLQPRVLGLGLRQKLQSILMSKIIQQECMCIFGIVSSFQAQPSGYDPCPLHEGRVQTMLLLLIAASSSTAPMAPGACPASSGPEAALQFPHGRAISERWTKPFGQPTREKEKEKQIFIPSASHRRKEG